MRKSVLAASAAALMAGGAQAKSRDPGPPDKRQVAIGAFDRIAVAGPFFVRVSTGKAAKISLAGPRTMLDDAELLVRGGQLIVRWQEGANWSRNGNHGVDIDITIPALREVTMAGAGAIHIDQVLSDSFGAIVTGAGGVIVEKAQVGRLHAQLAGSGSLTLGEIEATSLEADLAGSGAMRVAGRADTATLRVLSSGSFDNPDFAASNATILSGGSGVVRAAVSHSADIKSTGSGAIVLTGGAKCSVSKMGSGDVRCG
jgi:hypothetical protein